MKVPLKTYVLGALAGMALLVGGVAGVLGLSYGLYSLHVLFNRLLGPYELVAWLSLVMLTVAGVVGARVAAWDAREKMKALDRAVNGPGGRFA